jgi:hypothetical protein
LKNIIGFILVDLGNVNINIPENNWYYKRVEVTEIPSGARLISCVKLIYDANVLISVSSQNIILQSPVNYTLPTERSIYVVWAKF